MQPFLSSPPVPVKEQAMRILALAAHPDDLEILCAGTLVRFVAEGHDVVMCHAAKGDRGSFVHTSEEIATIREGEARRAAEIAGADYVSLGLRDTEIDASDPEQRRAVVDLVRAVRPELIITHRALETRLRLQLPRHGAAARDR
ncbi:MAG: PIG-L family deacetylase [Actinobacteria bacterium]|nr:MAG: PIG-L family deacetylase [Actinomycetota bacterium]